MLASNPAGPRRFSVRRTQARRGGKIFAPFLFLSLSRALSLCAAAASGGIRAGTFIGMGLSFHWKFIGIINAASDRRGTRVTDEKLTRRVTLSRDVSATTRSVNWIKSAVSRVPCRGGLKFKPACPRFRMAWLWNRFSLSFHHGPANRRGLFPRTKLGRHMRHLGQ